MFLSTLPDNVLVVVPRAVTARLISATVFHFFYFCKAIFFLPCSWKVQFFLSQLSFLHICSFSTNNNINDVLSTVTWSRLWVLKIAPDTTDYNPQSGSRGSRRCRCEDRSKLWRCVQSVWVCIKAWPNFTRSFLFFNIYVYVYVETGTKLVLESRAPPFGRLWRNVMRGENVVGERGCYTIS